MKTKIVIYSLLFMILFLSSYLLYNKNWHTKKERVSNGQSTHLFGENLIIDSKIVGEGTLDSVEQQSSEIVIAKKLAQNEATIIKDENGHLVATYTLSQLSVEKILKGTKLHNGQVITILENEAHDNDEKITYHIAGYEMMVTGNEYLLFLQKSETDPYYFITGVNFGKVPLGKEKSILRSLIDKNPSDYSNELQKQYEEIDAVREEARQKYIEQK